MFVILEHQMTDGVHWDLMIERPGQDDLPTWRLSDNPLLAPNPIPAERIGDHRRAYLQYEGDISGGRGRVRRIDGGRSLVERLEDDTLCATLQGAALSAKIEIARNRDGILHFRIER